MAGHVRWDSPGGLAEFAPPCVCGHPIGAHDQTLKKRRCTVWSPDQCPCKAYQPGDPKDWPPLEVQERLL
jgi:hypothetical protein